MEVALKAVPLSSKIRSIPTSFDISDRNDSRYDEMTTNIVSRSVEAGNPLVVVSMNYRVSAFGFIASQEVQSANASNIGLYDRTSTPASIFFEFSLNW